MPFTAVNIEQEIERRKRESPAFEQAWNESREEYRLIGEMAALRKQQNLTQTQLAEIIGKKQQVISRIEKHDNRPSLRMFCQILGAMGYTLKIEKK